jgi:Na+-translocating ferredoxin:NAD+ oxidoreductase RnfD subunit
MINVIIGLIPGTLAYVWFFGPGILINISIAVRLSPAGCLRCVYPLIQSGG